MSALMYQNTAFQSTHPSWGATNFNIGDTIVVHIFQSTHPSWGATSQMEIMATLFCYFNPRTHRGVRQPCLFPSLLLSSFQSTHPSWGATSKVKPSIRITVFQSTHPSWGATAKIAKFLLEFHYF